MHSPNPSGIFADFTGNVPKMQEKLDIDFAKSGGLVPVITQDAETGEVLMLAYVNAESWAETLKTGRAVAHETARDRHNRVPCRLSLRCAPRPPSTPAGRSRRS